MEKGTDPSSSKTSSRDLAEGRLGFGFSIEMRCSTYVLKLMCFFFPERELWTMRSCSLPVEVLTEVESSTVKGHSADSLDKTRGGESFRRASRGVRARRMLVSLLVWVRKGRLGSGEGSDGGYCSCDDGVSGDRSTSISGVLGRQRISVMLRCLRIGFVYETFAQVWVGRVGTIVFGRGSQSEPGCRGP